MKSINGLLIERMSQIPQTTSVLPHEFFEQNREIDTQKYLIDRTMFKTMTDAGVINWVPSIKKTLSGSNIRQWELSSSCCTNFHGWCT